MDPEFCFTLKITEGYMSKLFINKITRALVVCVMLSFTSFVSANPLIIPKPAPHSSIGQEAGRSVGVTTEFSLLGSYILSAERNTDSGGAYLFEVGTNKLLQTFSLPVSVDITRPDGTACTMSSTKGALTGERVAISDSWVALDSNKLGERWSAEDPTGTCGEAVPTVFLAKRNRGASQPYSDLLYSVPVPDGHKVKALAVEDNNLIIMSETGVYSFEFDGNSWQKTGAFITGHSFSAYQGALAIDGNRFVVGEPATNQIFVYQKTVNSWYRLSSYVGSASEFGKSVDISGDQIIVSSSSSVEFLKISGYSIQRVTRDNFFGADLVAISGSKAIAGYSFQSGSPKMYQFDSTSKWVIAGLFDNPLSQELAVSNDYFVPSSIDIEGDNILLGWKGYNPVNKDTGQLVGAMVYDRFSFNGNFRLQNYWVSDRYLNNESGAIQASKILPGWYSAGWFFEKLHQYGKTYYRIKNAWHPSEYLHVENGYLESGRIYSGWWSAQWELIPVILDKNDPYYGKTYKIKNRWTGAYINYEGLELKAGPIKDGWWSARWVIDRSEW
jgi:hypothetical protein